MSHASLHCRSGVSPLVSYVIRGARDLALHITQEALFAEYACSSYCWGGEVPVRLTIALLDKFQPGIELGIVSSHLSGRS